MDEEENARRKVQKLYVGGRSKKMAEALARAFASGEQSALTEAERRWLGDSALEPGATMVASAVELALAVLCARVFRRPVLDENGIPIDAAEGGVVRQD